MDRHEDSNESENLAKSTLHKLISIHGGQTVADPVRK